MNVAGIRSFNELNAAVRAENSQELGKNQFLELMITQLKHQDPLNPAQNEDFIAQLAQFSSLEGIENLNKSVDSMATAMRATVTMEAAALVGRSVLVPTDRTFMQGANLVGSVNVTESTSNLVVEVSSPSGELIRRIDVGPAAVGANRFLWDGLDASGEAQSPGVYRIRAYAAQGESTSEFSVDLPELVASVSLEATGIQLNLAGGSTVPVTEVKEIQ
ncbi:MAG: flagellar hook assembly protein FlgD [Gammaproteobacteria bacterium]|nr:flagellar hook assembly protein FlgD [Gammaproteobacteria bacterium]